MTKKERCELILKAVCENNQAAIVEALADVLIDMNKPVAKKAKVLPKVDPWKQGKSWSEWYELYPRHEGKEAGFQAWCKLEEKDYSMIFNALSDQLKSGKWAKCSTKMIPLPASWLNGKRWQDEVETKRKKPVRLCCKCNTEPITVELSGNGYCRPCLTEARGY